MPDPISASVSVDELIGVTYKTLRMVKQKYAAIKHASKETREARESLENLDLVLRKLQLQLVDYHQTFYSDGRGRHDLLQDHATQRLQACNTELGLLNTILGRSEIVSTRSGSKNLVPSVRWAFGGQKRVRGSLDRLATLTLSLQFVSSAMGRGRRGGTDWSFCWRLDTTGTRATMTMLPVLNMPRVTAWPTSGSKPSCAPRSTSSPISSQNSGKWPARRLSTRPSDRRRTVL